MDPQQVEERHIGGCLAAADWAVIWRARLEHHWAQAVAAAISPKEVKGV
jgi:hypothetical protein